MTSRSHCFLLIGFLFAQSSLRGAPVTVPYSIDFSTFAVGDTTIPNLTETPPDKWTISADHKYRVSADIISALPADRSAALNITNLAGRDFEVSTRFTLLQFPANPPAGYDAAIGVAAFSDSTNFALGNRRYQLTLLLASTNGGTGQLDLLERDETGFFNLFSSELLPITVGGTYDLTLRGHAHGGELDLTGLASNGTKTISLFLSDNTPRTGANFGLVASAAGGGGATLTANFSQFSVVPEPAALLLLLPSLCLRRRARQ
jgi:hypothetical protein